MEVRPYREKVLLVRQVRKIGIKVHLFLSPKCVLRGFPEQHRSCSRCRHLPAVPVDTLFIIIAWPLQVFISVPNVLDIGLSLAFCSQQLPAIYCFCLKYFLHRLHLNLNNSFMPASDEQTPIQGTIGRSSNAEGSATRGLSTPETIPSQSTRGSSSRFAVAPLGTNQPSNPGITGPGSVPDFLDGIVDSCRNGEILLRTG